MRATCPCLEQALEIARNPLVHERGRSHHHGDAIDQLPAFLVRPALIEGAERLDRKARLAVLRPVGHLSAPAPNGGLFAPLFVPQGPQMRMPPSP